MKVRIEIEAMGWIISRSLEGREALLVVGVIVMFWIGGC